MSRGAGSHDPCIISPDFFREHLGQAGAVPPADRLLNTDFTTGGDGYMSRYAYIQRVFPNMVDEIEQLYWPMFTEILLLLWRFRLISLDRSPCNCYYSGAMAAFNDTNAASHLWDEEHM